MRRQTARGMVKARLDGDVPEKTISPMALVKGGSFKMSSGTGSAGNVIAGLASFFIPGLGQLVQGRLIAAVLQFGLAVVLWFFMLGWIMNIVSALSAATYRSRE